MQQAEHHCTRLLQPAPVAAKQVVQQADGPSLPRTACPPRPPLHRRRWPRSMLMTSRRWTACRPSPQRRWGSGGGLPAGFALRFGASKADACALVAISKARMLARERPACSGTPCWVKHDV